MLRRNARLRREYLYRKSLEGKDREEYERKLKIRRALEGHSPAKVMSNDHQSLCFHARVEPLLMETTEQELTLVSCAEQRVSPSQQSCARRSER